MYDTNYNNIACYLRNGNLEEAFNEFSLVYGNDTSNNEKLLYDDMVLLLFSLIMNLDKHYRLIAKNIRLDQFNSIYANNDTIDDKLVRCIYNRDFTDAIYALIDSKERSRSFTSKEAILLELLNVNRKKDREYNKYLLELINNRQYDLTIDSLMEKRKDIGISKPERTLLYALRSLKKIKETFEIPEALDVDSKSVLHHVANNNYYKALYLQGELCKRKNIKLKENCLYVVLDNICMTISNIENNDIEEFTLDKKEDYLLNDLDDNIEPYAVEDEKPLIKTKKITDQFLY